MTKLIDLLSGNDDLYRMCPIKKYAILLLGLLPFAAAAQNPLKPYVNFLQHHTFLSARDYFLDRFRKYDIVVFSERDHRDITQYELLLDVIRDTAFHANIYTEVGACNNAKRINAFLTNANLEGNAKQKELLDIYRNLTAVSVWEKYNYYYLLSELQELNKQRRDGDKVLIFPLDVKFDWQDYTMAAQLKPLFDYSSTAFIDRNYAMGKHFLLQYEAAKKQYANGKKALVIMNTYHGYIRIPAYKPLPTKASIYSAAEFIYKSYPLVTTNIYINYYRSGDSVSLSHNGLLDAAFVSTRTDDIGFDLKGTPFGKTSFDLYNFGPGYARANYDYIFDGMIYYKNVSDLEFVTGIPNIFPPELAEEYFRRKSLINNITPEESRNKYAAALREVNQKQVARHDTAELESISRQIKKWLDK